MRIRSHVFSFVPWLISQNLNLVLTKPKSFTLELEVTQHEGIIYLLWEE